MAEGTWWLVENEADWSPNDLFEYIHQQMDRLFIEHDCNKGVEVGILRSFMSRHDHSVAIARYVYEALDGLWGYHPVKPTDFCKAADWRFGDPLNVLVSR